MKSRCSVDWNRIDACNFFLSSSPDQPRCCSCSAVRDWLEQKCLCDAFITFTFSKWFYHCLEKSKKFHSVLLTFTKCFFIQHCLWKIKNFLSVMHSSFYFRKMFFCCLGKKFFFFFLIIFFHLWFWKKILWRRKYISYHKATFIFTFQKSTVFVFF